MTESVDTLQQLDTFLVRQHYTLGVNRYDVTTREDGDRPGELLATCQQKRMALREEVTFYADEARQRPVFRFKSQKALDVHGQTDVTDADGRSIGWFRKSFGASLLRTTWVMGHDGIAEATGRERNVLVAVLRRVWDLVPFTEMVPFAWPVHFDFTTDDGRPVMEVERKFGSLRDTYRVVLHDDRLDRRVAASMVVAADALANR